jgi:hypothetical protein
VTFKANESARVPVVENVSVLTKMSSDIVVALENEEGTGLEAWNEGDHSHPPFYAMMLVHSGCEYSNLLGLGDIHGLPVPFRKPRSLLLANVDD